jgi:hypothetical protein
VGQDTTGRRHRRDRRGKLDHQSVRQQHHRRRRRDLLV